MNNKQLGLKDGDLETIIAVLKKYPRIEQAIIFGSRAKGDHKHGSDVDMVLKGNVEDIAPEISYSLNEDSLLPYKFDVLDYNSISNQNLIDHINRVGIIFYEKNYE
jgi:predicted nucleotidyltransferase